MSGINWTPPPMTDGELEEYLGDHAGLVAVDRTRMSRLLREQLAHGIKTRTLESFAITDVLEGLENHQLARRTVERQPFHHPPLKGLMHVHFSQARFILKNLLLEVKSKKGQKRLKTALSEESGEFDDVSIGKIGHEMSIGMYQNRALRGSLTGEWIIFAEHGGTRHYMCIAGHEEGNELIYRRMIERCDDKFRQIILAVTH